MSDEHDLETRLRSLGELSPPTRPLLDCETMHVGASRMQRRQQLMVAIPSILLVVVVLASAVALRNNASSQLGLADGNQVSTQGPAAPARLTDRDRQLLDFVESAVRLRKEIVMEGLDAASYASTNKVFGDLAPQRSRTDAALNAFEQRVTDVDPGRESQPMKDALKQFGNRTKSLGTIRVSVDRIQTDAARLSDEYASVAIDLLAVQRALLQTVDNPPLFRGLWTLKNLGEVTRTEGDTATLLTVAVEIGYFPAVLPTGSAAAPAKNNPLGEGCGEDAAGNGQQCKLYENAIRRNEQMTLAQRDFDDLASGEQKQLMRFADAGLKYDELKRHAFEDGQGHNDLRGLTPGTTDVPAAEFRAAARERINKLVDAELQTLNAVRAAG